MSSSRIEELTTKGRYFEQGSGLLISPTPKPSTAVPTTLAPTAIPATVASQNFGVNYNISASWNCGYNISVEIVNKSSTQVTSCALSWKLSYGETFQNYWNANCSISSSSVTCSNMSYNNTLAANGGSQNFGAQPNCSTGPVSQPVTFTVNGQTVTR